MGKEKVLYIHESVKGIHLIETYMYEKIVSEIPPDASSYIDEGVEILYKEGSVVVPFEGIDPRGPTTLLIREGVSIGKNVVVRAGTDIPPYTHVSSVKHIDSRWIEVVFYCLFLLVIIGCVIFF